MALSPIILGIVCIYLAGMLWIGWFSSRQISVAEDFLVAGRRLGPWMLAGTLAATEIGGGSSMGVAEKAYGSWGLSAMWYVVTMAITFLVLALIAPRLRSSVVTTVPEYFRRRYGEPNGIVNAVIFLLPLVGLTATQIIASSVILSVITQLDYATCVAIVTAVVTLYSVMGGLWSVTLTDVVQCALILIGLILAIPFAVSSAGGWSTLVENLEPSKLEPIEGVGVGTIIALIVMYVASFTVGQETMQRYYAARDPQTARRASLGVAGIYLLFALVPTLLGLAASSMVAQGVLDSTLIDEQGARYVLPVLAQATLPPWLAGLVFAALISATMSSADSDLLAAGSIFSNDIYGKWKTAADDSERLRITRIAMVVVAAIAAAVAWSHTTSLVTLLMFSFSLRAGGAFLPFLLGHYWKRISKVSCLASLIAGSVAVIAADNLAIGLAIEPIVIGIGVCALVLLITTWRFPDQRNRPTDEDPCVQSGYQS